MNIKSLVRKNILELKPYTSARDMYNSGILLDANENSFGSVFKIDELSLNRYPNPHQKEIRSAVGTYLNINPANLFFGVGSDEIIDLLIRIFCEPGEDNVIIPQPTYGMYRVACSINNISVKDVLLRNNFQINLEKTFEAVNDKTKIIFLCSPNNPTGNLLNHDDVKLICSSFNGIVVLDEAYIDFAEDKSLLNEIYNFANLVVLRTFSKAWGLAGIRLGYCAANDEIINLLFKIKAPYNINAFTKNALLKGIKNHQKKLEFVSRIISERERLIKLLKEIEGIEHLFETDANFILFKCKNAKEVQKKLADAGIIIRDRSNEPMLENCLRLTVGTAEENSKLLDELKRILE